MAKVKEKVKTKTSPSLQTQIDSLNQTLNGVIIEFEKVERDVVMVRELVLRVSARMGLELEGE